MVDGYCSAVEHEREWSSRIAASVGERVAYFRERITDERGRKLTAQGLADRCTQLGLPLTRPTVAKLEKGLRDTITVGEVQVLAAALGVPPIALVYPLGQRQAVEILPGTQAETWAAVKWFTAEGPFPEGGTPGRDWWTAEGPAAAAGHFRDHDRFLAEWKAARAAAAAFRQSASAAGTGEREAYLEAAAAQDKHARALADHLRAIRGIMRKEGLALPALELPGLIIDDQLAAAPPQPIVAAIVTSAKGVLITRRQDGKPPWGFVTGEIEPGELAEDAAVREVKEETGCEVRVGEEIGRRVHPATGRHMIYLAATPVRGTKVIVGDEAELAEVRWASPAEALELMPDMFGPVRDYLARQAR